MELALVTTPEALTPEWLTQALAQSLDGGRVTGVECEPVGTGQVGDVVRLSLALEDAPEGCLSSVIAKLPAADEASRAAGIAVRSYELECRFYQQLAPHLPVRTPHCHQALFDETSHDFILLFEDLAPASQGDQIVGCDADQADLVVREMTRLHGPRFGDPALDDVGWLNRRDAGTVALLEGLVAGVLPGFGERYGDRMGPELLAVYEQLGAKVGSYLGSMPRPFTVTHGDFRLDNLLFGVGGDPNALAVVDFQGAAHGSGSGDLAYFLGSGLLPDVRRSNERELVASYHEALTIENADGFDISGYSLDECWEGYRLGTFSGMLVTLVASMLVTPTARGDEMFVAMGSRFAQHALDLESLDLL